jgi:hypothetical protein
LHKEKKSLGCVFFQASTHFVIDREAKLSMHFFLSILMWKNVVQLCFQIDVYASISFTQSQKAKKKFLKLFIGTTLGKTTFVG